MKRRMSKRRGVVLDPFADTLAEFIRLVLVGLALSLKNPLFVWNSLRSLSVTLIKELLEILTSCDNHQADLRSDYSNRVLKSWTCAGVQAVRHAPLWILLVATLHLSLNFCIFFCIRLLMVLRCGIFLPGNSLQNCLWTNDRSCKVQGFWSRSWMENWFSASILVSDETCSYVLWITWQGNEKKI